MVEAVCLDGFCRARPSRHPKLNRLSPQRLPGLRRCPAIRGRSFSLIPSLLHLRRAARSSIVAIACSCKSQELLSSWKSSKTLDSTFFGCLPWSNGSKELGNWIEANVTRDSATPG